MATSSYMSFLMHGTGTGTITYEKLCDIKEYPDIQGEPEMLETTTLSDKMQTFVPGVQANEGKTFTANYDKTAYQALKALEGKTEKYAIWLGGDEAADGTVTPTGSEGQFSFDGILSVRVAGAGVNAVRDMTITIAPTSVIVDSFPA